MMNRVIFLFVFLFCCHFGYGQNTPQIKNIPQIQKLSTSNQNTSPDIGRTCTTDERHTQKMKDPVFAQQYNKLKARVSQEVLNKTQAPCASPLIIPIAVHFEATNISNQCMIDATLTQIEQMNLDFAGCNTNAGTLCDWIEAGCDNFGGSAGADAMPDDGACIQFCLADQNLPADGNLIPDGVAITTGYSTATQNAPALWQGYLNIYVGDAGGGILGFVPFLGGASNANNTLGASVLTSAFGSQTFGGCEGVDIGVPYDGGATLTHEVGHWFGLEHTFSDAVADTPPQTVPNYGCPVVDLVNCTSSEGADYGGNFMDYVDDDCMFTFTQDQVDIMLATADAQANWATNSVSCMPTYPPCGDSQASVCQVCDFTATFTATCSADGTTYTVLVILSGGTGPFNLTESSGTAPESYTGVGTGAYLFTVTTPNVTTITITDTGAADCMEEELILDPCVPCNLEVVPDYSAVTCEDFGGTLLPAIPLIVTNGAGTVWIDQDGNTTFDTGVDIDITGGAAIGFPSSDLTLTIYDSGDTDCALEVTVLSSNFSCDGVNEGDPATVVGCFIEAEITGTCSADGTTYSVDVTISGGGTGPFDLNESGGTSPDSYAGVGPGTYTFTMIPAGTDATITITDTGAGACMQDIFLPDGCNPCNLEIIPDYSDVTCEDFGGTLLPAIALDVINGIGQIWIDQDGNTTFDTGADIDITGGAIIGFPTSDLTFTVYDGGDPDCALTVTVLSGSYSCDGVLEGGTPLLVCGFEATADVVNYTCNGDGTAAVTINVNNPVGDISFDNPDVTAITPNVEYTINVPVGAGCGVTTIVASENADISLGPIVEITSPPSIAGSVLTVGTNAFPDWGIDINTVTPCVSGILVAPTDGTAPENDFCEPTPPATPTAAQCANIAGNIAIIDRGACPFTTKAENAQACGAVAVVICNNDTAAPDAVITMAGTSIGAVTIPAVFLSYNQCQAIYMELANGDVSVCIGAPIDVPCEQTITIDACAFDCGTPYCDQICFAEYVAAPGPDDFPDATLCVTPVGCGVDASCEMTQACDDGNPCTENDMETVATDNSICVPCAGTPIASCTGTTTAQACDDGDPCTENDMEEVDDCDGTVCVPCAGTPVASCTGTTTAQACDDGDPCTENDMEEIDDCDGVTVCVPCAGTPIASCTGTTTAQACDDGDPCTENDMEEIDDCDGVTVCVPCAGTPTDCSDAVVQACDDGDPCTENDMEEVNACGVCVPCAGTPIASCTGTTTAQACDDGDPCTENDMEEIDDCDGSVCVPCAGTPIASCAGATTAQACDDGDPCTENDMEEIDDCDGSVCVPCAGTPIASCTGTTTVQACDDGDPCTENDMEEIDDCDGSVCVPCAGTPADCADAVVQACDDGDPCTINDVEEVNACGVCVPCAGTPDPSNCDAECVTIQPCDDGDPCTAGEQEAISISGAICEPCGLNAFPVDPACGDPTANNYDPDAVCIDNSLCTYDTCEDAIAGTITLSDCDFTGTIVTIYDSNGDEVGTTTADADGNYMLAGPFNCGEYAVELSNVPTCYSDANGAVGPRSFTINGDGTADGVNFIAIPDDVPTVGEWGLIILGLLMSIVAVVGIRARRAEEVYA